MPRDSYNKAAGSTLRTALIMLSPSWKARFDAASDWRQDFTPLATDLLNRDLKRQVDAAVDHAADHVKKLRERYRRDVLSDNEVEAVLAATNTALSQATKLFSTESIVKDATGPTEIFDELLPKARQLWLDSKIADAGQQFGCDVLRSACYELVSWIRQLPGISDSAAWETLINTNKLLNMTRTAVLELSTLSDRVVVGTGQLEASQRMDLAASLGRMELFGLPVVNPAFRNVPIDVSYVSARTTMRASELSVPFLSALSAHLKGNRDRRSGLRVLVTGRAGSGKTTVAQWLAYQVSLNRLDELNDTIGKSLPFFARMRELTRGMGGAFPPDSALVVGGNARNHLKEGWLTELASSRHPPLIILDGWDEIHPGQRRTTESWLERLVSRCDGAHIIITSRPEAARDPIFPELRFSQIELAPLRPEDALTLVNKWFAGVRENLDIVAEFARNTVDEAERQLVLDARSQVLSQLMDSPLLTSMLCYLYASNVARNPPSRAYLYEAVTTALSHTRDLLRGVADHTWDVLSLEQKEKLLSHVAVKMIESGTTRISIAAPGVNTRPSLEGEIAPLIPRFGLGSGMSAAVADALVQRSIVLTDVGGGEAEFIHRSIQEYYAALHFRTSSSPEQMFSLVDRVGTLNLLPFAVYRSNETFGNSVVQWLADHARLAAGSSRRELLMILMESLSSATMVDPNLREDAMAMTEELFPPTTPEDAAAVSALGDVAVRRLSVESTPVECYAYAIDALSRIGTEAAIEALREYAIGASRETSDFLLRAWMRLDNDQFANRVLSTLDRRLSILVRNPDRLKGLAQLDNLQRLEILGGSRRAVSLSAGDLDYVSQIQGLPELKLVRAALNFPPVSLRQMSGLKSVEIVDCVGLPALDQALPLGLQQLRVAGATVKDLDWNQVLRQQPSLRVLWLERIGWLSRWGEAPISSQTLSALHFLRTIHLSSDAPRVEGFDWLQSTPNLRRLEIHHTIDEDGLTFLPHVHGLTSLVVRVGGGIGAVNLDGLSFSGLRHLSLFGASKLMVESLVSTGPIENLTLVDCVVDDIGTLSLPDSLRSVVMTNCLASHSLTLSGNPRDVGTLSRLRHFSWTGRHLRNLDFIERLPALEVLTIEEAVDLEDVNGLDRVRDGCNVRITGVPWDLDQGPVVRLDRRARVSFEPLSYGDYGPAAG